MNQNGLKLVVIMNFRNSVTFCAQAVLDIRIFGGSRRPRLRSALICIKDKHHRKVGLHVNVLVLVLLFLVSSWSLLH